MNATSMRIRGRIRNNSPVKEADPRRWRAVSILLALCLALALPVLFGIMQQEQYVRTRYAIEDLNSRKSSLDQEYLRLRIERSSLEALDLVSQAASRDLGLVPGESGQRIIAKASEPTSILTPGIAIAAAPPSGNRTGAAVASIAPIDIPATRGKH